jgi:hypothetical protein
MTQMQFFLFNSREFHNPGQLIYNSIRRRECMVPALSLD